MALDERPAALAAGTDECCSAHRLDTPGRERALAISAIAKALADPIRVEIVQLLQEADGEVCQCELQPLFGVSQPTLSHHLKKLHGARLIDVERRGKWAYYSVGEDALEVLRAWVS